MAFMPEHAPLVFLMYLGAISLVVCSALVALVAAFLKRQRWVALGAAGVAVVTATVYGLVLAAVSLTSYQVVLPPGDWKYFCEVDCHIAYSVAGVESAVALGPELQQTTAHGKFVVVRLKTWFDESSISPNRGDAPLVSGERQVVLLDRAGRSFAPSSEGTAALSRIAGAPGPVSRPLRPGESFTSTLVFDVPQDARGLVLYITAAHPDVFTQLIIDHEESFLHKKVYLALEPGTSIRGSKVLP
jgi:hypothetical protein